MIGTDEDIMTEWSQVAKGIDCWLNEIVISLKLIQHDGEDDCGIGMGHFPNKASKLFDIFLGKATHHLSDVLDGHGASIFHLNPTLIINLRLPSIIQGVSTGVREGAQNIPKLVGEWGVGTGEGNGWEQEID